MKKNKWVQASTIIFIAVFLVTAILEEGTVDESRHVQAAQVNQKSSSAIETGQEEGLLALALTGAERISEVAEVPVAAFHSSGMADNGGQAKSHTETGSLVQMKEGTEPVLDAAQGKSSAAQGESSTAQGESSAAQGKGSGQADEEGSVETSVNYVIANVETSLNIRKEASLEGEIIGKLYRGAKATIVERGEEWTEIESGSVKGFVSSEYLMFDEEAVKGAEIFGTRMITVKTDLLRIRRTPGMDGEILDLAEKGAKLAAADKGEDKEGWVAVDYKEGIVGYVSEEFVKVRVELEEAISIEEEMRLLELKRLEEAQAAQAAQAQAAQAQASQGQAAASGSQAGNAQASTGTVNRGAVSLSEDELYLLAAVVHMEAGSEPYEGKLAVASVVINRLKSGLWGNSLSSVIYAPNQFPGAASGLLARYMNEGPNSGSRQAAAEAAAGVNNIGSYLSFCATRVANYSSYSSYTIIGNHCFYLR